MNKMDNLQTNPCSVHFPFVPCNSVNDLLYVRYLVELVPPFTRLIYYFTTRIHI